MSTSTATLVPGEFDSPSSPALAPFPGQAALALLAWAEGGKIRCAVYDADLGAFSSTFDLPFGSVGSDPPAVATVGDAFLFTWRFQGDLYYGSLDVASVTVTQSGTDATFDPATVDVEGGGLLLFAAGDNTTFDLGTAQQPIRFRRDDQQTFNPDCDDQFLVPYASSELIVVVDACTTDETYHYEVLLEEGGQGVWADPTIVNKTPGSGGQGF